MQSLEKSGLSKRKQIIKKCVIQNFIIIEKYLKTQNNIFSVLNLIERIVTLNSNKCQDILTKFISFCLKIGKQQKTSKHNLKEIHQYSAKYYSTQMALNIRQIQDVLEVT